MIVLAKPKIKFEDAILKLEEIVHKMEDQSTSLEETFKLYKEGVSLYETCAKTIAAIEKDVTILVEKSKGILTEEPFDSMEDEHE